MILGVHKDRDKPHWADFVLATAFESLEAEKCGKCGVPAWHAFSEDNTIEFAMDEHKCHACEFKEKADEKVKKEKPGITRFVKAVPVEGIEELPSRADFQRDMIAKAIKEQAKKMQE
jgi:hypothetical protein